MKWCQPLSYHMAEFNLCDPHVLKPVEQSKVLLMKLKGIQEGFYELRGSGYIENEKASLSSE